LLQELRKYIPVHIYGECGNNTCQKENGQCFRDIENNYKFYLSFENSICNEYITEKFWKILGRRKHC
jgi:alpha-1,3-fucosyltransferase